MGWIPTRLATIDDIFHDQLHKLINIMLNFSDDSPKDGKMLDNGIVCQGQIVT